MEPARAEAMGSRPYRPAERGRLPKVGEGVYHRAVNLSRRNTHRSVRNEPFSDGQLMSYAKRNPSRRGRGDACPPLQSAAVHGHPCFLGDQLRGRPKKVGSRWHKLPLGNIATIVAASPSWSAAC
ncbi:hypothetical protein E4K10_43630 [Streptomyces sp. T1317-0309]|nr:hypothetical protein E4K10_43630 [Streptomyces sp. T1317-0309]